MNLFDRVMCDSDEFFFFAAIVSWLQIYIIGLPIPRPGMGGASPPAFGLLIVSSTDRIKHVASAAACNAFNLMIDGSQTHASKLSEMCSLPMSTPYHEFPR